jgi:2-alkyl-3-oxoalkanoate reductase
MEALVTGGSGFIGNHLIDELVDKGYHVRVLRRTTSNTHHLDGKKVNWTVGDLTDKKSLVHACQQIDVVFHVAALPRDWGPKKTFFEINLHGTKNLLDACVENKVPRFIFMSSAAVYGFPRTHQPIKEEHTKKPTAKYGESKYHAEQLLWDYGATFGITVSAVRSPLVIGPGDYLIAPFLIKALQQKRMFYIGDGKQHMSVSDGRDVAYCLRLAGETDKAHGQAYNVKSFDSTPKQLIQTLAEKMHVPTPIRHRSYLYTYVLASLIEGFWVLRRKQEPPFTRHKVKVLGHTRLLDITKAEKDLGYTPRYSIASTIDDLLTWYQRKEAEAATVSPR